MPSCQTTMQGSPTVMTATGTAVTAVVSQGSQWHHAVWPHCLMMDFSVPITIINWGPPYIIIYEQIYSLLTGELEKKIKITREFRA